ncbi:MAG: phosphopyruvate hydratase [Gammaproteobacteria bacterium]|nr:phosphopyruvate hydratase [Gammaproteobacteria bacterium]|tara:strand:+ start:29302 stop:30558 length:1257 start_codon:yes stop_codon:yes gene_type:complete
MKIKQIDALEVLDSRGKPTIRTTVYLEDGSRGAAIVPSGASAGSFEAHELRDGDNSRYFGFGTLKAVEQVKGLSNHLIGIESDDQNKIDTLLIDIDGTENKEKIGANSILSISLACARASTNSLNIPLYEYINILFNNLASKENKFSMPRPMLNILNGGVHANNNIDIQEFMIIPSNKFSFKEGLRKAAEVYMHLKNNLDQNKLSTTVGDEGGFAPNFESNEIVIEEIIKSIEETGMEYGEDISLGLDCASSELYKDKIYHLEGEGNKFSSDEMIDYLMNLVNKYQIISIEDPLDESDWSAWKKLSEKTNNLQIVGDDIFVTNKELLEKGIAEKVANSILIKPNQIGTLTETFQAIDLAKSNDYGTIISHRSGETEDTFISDLAVGVDARQIKSGAPARSDRTAKYNRLLIIENELYP